MSSLHILILLLDHPPFQAYMSAPELLSMAAVAHTITSANLATGTEENTASIHPTAINVDLSDAMVHCHHAFTRMWRVLDVVSAADLDTCVQESCQIVSEATSSSHSTSTGGAGRSIHSSLRQALEGSSWFRQQYAPHYQRLAGLYSLD
mmetsp:Transcript_65157/g.128892  ORF Transcript_65157/g.128892 Transcript_65157/m.128892 type:complete len:149 (-) Transcript_65157:264-710(-)